MNFNLNYFVLSTVAAIFITGNVAVADADTTQLRGGGGTNEDATRYNSRELDVDVDTSGGGKPDNELVESAFEGDDAEGNIIDTDLVLSTTQDTTTTDEYIMSSPPGICDETTGDWKDVGSFFAGTPIIPGWTYNGLDFKTRDYKFRNIGYCVVDYKREGIDGWCGDSRTVTEAWQNCAKLCNSDAKCISYSVHLDDSSIYYPGDIYYSKIRNYDCYLHDKYECTNGKDIYPPCEKGDDSCGVWSGVCRPMSEHGDYYDKSKTTQNPICSSF